MLLDHLPNQIGQLLPNRHCTPRLLVYLFNRYLKRAGAKIGRVRSWLFQNR